MVDASETGVQGVCTYGDQVYTGRTTLYGDLATIVNGEVRFNGPSVIGADMGIYTSAGGGAPITFNGTVDGAFNLTVDSGSSTTTFMGAVGSLAPFGSGSGASITILGGTTEFVGTAVLSSGIAASSDVIFREDVTVGAGDTASFFNANVTMDGMTFTTALDATFGDESADVLAFTGTPAAISASRDGVSVTANTINSGVFDLALTADGIDFVGGPSTVSGTGALLLQPFSDTTSVGIGSAAAGTLNISDDDLAALSDGFASVTIGRATGMHEIEVAASSFADPLVLRTPMGGHITVDGPLYGTGNASLTLLAPSAAGSIILNGDLGTEGQAITLTGGVLLETNPSMTIDTTMGGQSSGAAITVTAPGTIDEDLLVSNALTLNGGTGGVVTVSGAVGGVTPIGSLTATGSSVNIQSVCTLGSQTYTGAVTLNGNLVSTEAGAITVNGPATLAVAASIMTAGGDGDDIMFNGPITGGFDLALNSGGGGDIVVTGASSLPNLVIENAFDATLGDLAITGTLTQLAGSGTTTFGGVSEVGSLDMTGTNFAVNGDLAVGGTTSFTGDLTTTAPIVSSGIFTNTGNAILGANVTTDNSNLSITGNLGISEGSTVVISTGTGAGNITVGGTTNGTAGGVGENLTLLGGTGNIVLTGAVGGVSALNNLGITSANNVNLPSLRLAGSLTQASGSGTTVFGGAAAVGSLNMRAGNFTVNGALTSGGATSFTGNLTTSAPIVSAGSFTETGNAVLGSSVTTSGQNLSVAGNLTITDGASVALSTGAGGGNISVSGTTNGTSGGAAENLTLLCGTGDIVLTGAVGGTVPLNNLAITSANNVSLPAVTLTGALTQAAGSGTTSFNGAASVGSLNMTASNFAVNGAITSGGELSFTGIVTTTAPISSLGPLTLSGDAVLGSDVSTADSDLTIMGNLWISEGTAVALSSGTGAGNITVGGTTNGASGGSGASLVLQSGLGNVTLTGAVGGTTPLENLTITGANDVSLPAMTLTGSLVQESGLGTTTFNGASSVGSLDMSSANFALNGELASGGATSFTGNLTSSAPIVSAGAFTTVGDATLGSDVTTDNSDLGITGNLWISEGATVVLSSGTGAGGITVGGTTDGTSGGSGESLVLQSGLGNVTLAGAVGGTTPLEGLLITGANDVSLPAMTLTGSLVQESGLGTTTFNGASSVGSLDMSSANFALNGELASGGATSFTGNLTSSAPIMSAGAFNVTGNATLGADVTTMDSDLLVGGNLWISEGATVVLSSGAGAGGITVGGTTDGASGGSGESLVISAGTGNVLLAGSVGGTTLLDNLTITDSNEVSLPSVGLTGSLVSSSTGLTTLNGPVASGGNVEITSTGLAFAGSGSIIAASGNAILNAGTGMIVGGTSLVDIAALSASLSAGSGIGLSGDAVHTSVGTLNASSSGGSIYVVESDAVTLGEVVSSGEVSISNMSGAMTVGSVFSGSSVVLASAGSMLDGNAGSDNVTCGTATLSSGSDIGSSTDALDTAVDSLTAAAPSGSIYLDERDAILLESVSALNEASVTTHSGGNITLNQVSADVVTLTVLDEPKAPYSGAILAVAGTGLNIIARIANLSARSDIGEASNYIRVRFEILSAIADHADIYINNSAPETLTLQSVEATGTVNITNLGTILMNSLVSQGAVLVATGGSVLSVAPAGSTALSIAQNAYLLAGAGSVGASGSPLPVNVAGTLTVSAPNPPAGNAVTLSGYINRLVLENVNGPVEVNGRSGMIDPMAYLRAISNIDNPYLANVPGFCSWSLIVIRDDETEGRRGLIHAEGGSGIPLYLTPWPKELTSPGNGE
jgi:hypothetical protein